MFAVDIPRSSWQCIERIAWSSPGTFSLRRRTRSAISIGVAYPTVSGMLIVVAPAFTTASTVRQRYSKSVREASSVENSTSRQRERAYFTVSTHHCRIFSRSARNFFWMWMSEVPRNVWIRGRFATFTASHSVSMSFFTARARPVMTGPLTVFATAWTDSKSPGEEAGNPASMMSTFSTASCRAISTFWSLASFAPGTCSPSRNVVSKMKTLSAISSSLLVCDCLWLVVSPQKNKPPVGSAPGGWKEKTAGTCRPRGPNRRKWCATRSGSGPAPPGAE